MGKNKNKKNKNVNNNVTKKVENEVKTNQANVEEKDEKAKIENNESKTKKIVEKEKNNNKAKNQNNKKQEENKNKNEKKDVKDSKKEEKVDKKSEKSKDKKDKELDEKKIEKKIKKSSNNDTKIILGIVAAVIIIAFGIFGFYFAKANLEYCVSFDGGTISNADYEVYYRTFATMLQYYGYPEAEIPKQIANKAAIDAIIVKLANEAKIEISDEDKAAIEKVFNDKEQLSTFTQQGIDIARMRKLYYNDYLITAYIKKQAEEANNDEVAEYIKSNADGEVDMNEYNTAHILFKIKDDSGNDLEDSAKAEKKAKAEEVLQRALKGEDFAALAKEFSEDTTAENGGAYTCYDDGYTVEEYIKAAKTLNDGEVYATLVETSYGYHIIKMNSKVENGRVHNENERQEFVDEKINKLSEEKHVDIDEEKLNKLIEKITGKAISSSDDSNNNNDSTSSDDTNSGNDENNNSDNNNENNNGENTNNENTTNGENSNSSSGN